MQYHCAEAEGRVHPMIRRRLDRGRDEILRADLRRQFLEPFLLWRCSLRRVRQRLGTIAAQIENDGQRSDEVRIGCPIQRPLASTCRPIP